MEYGKRRAALSIKIQIRPEMGATLKAVVTFVGLTDLVISCSNLRPQIRCSFDLECLWRVTVVLKGWPMCPPPTHMHTHTQLGNNRFLLPTICCFAVYLDLKPAIVSSEKVDTMVMCCTLAFGLPMTLKAPADHSVGIRTKLRVLRVQISWLGDKVREWLWAPNLAGTSFPRVAQWEGIIAFLGVRTWASLLYLLCVYIYVYSIMYPTWWLSGEMEK